MANVLIVASPQIVSNETNITENVYKDDGTKDLVRGGLCVLSAGTIIPAETTPGSAQKIENDAAPFDAAARYFISLEDKTADGGFVSVSEITRDTILEGFVVDATGSSLTMTQAQIGTVCEGYIDAAGKWAINNATTKGVFEIVDVDSNYSPYRHPDAAGMDEDSGGTRHGRVKFRFIASKLR